MKLEWLCNSYLYGAVKKKNSDGVSLLGVSCRSLGLLLSARCCLCEADPGSEVMFFTAHPSRILQRVEYWLLPHICPQEVFKGSHSSEVAVDWKIVRRAAPHPGDLGAQARGRSIIHRQKYTSARRTTPKVHSRRFYYISQRYPKAATWLHTWLHCSPSTFLQAAVALWSSAGRSCASL